MPSAANRSRSQRRVAWPLRSSWLKKLSLTRLTVHSSPPQISKSGAWVLDVERLSAAVLSAGPRTRPPLVGGRAAVSKGRPGSLLVLSRMESADRPQGSSVRQVSGLPASLRRRERRPEQGSAQRAAGDATRRRREWPKRR